MNGSHSHRSNPPATTYERIENFEKEITRIHFAATRDPSRGTTFSMDEVTLGSSYRIYRNTYISKIFFESIFSHGAQTARLLPMALSIGYWSQHPHWEGRGREKDFFLRSFTPFSTSHHLFTPDGRRRELRSHSPTGGTGTLSRRRVHPAHSVDEGKHKISSIWPTSSGTNVSQ